MIAKTSIPVGANFRGSPHAKSREQARSARLLKRWTFLLSLTLSFAAPPAVAAEVQGMLTPRLSPDGEWIAVSYQGAIAKLRRAGGPLIVLTREEGWDSDPAWSPDSTRIAYVHTPVAGSARGGGSVKMIDAQTGAPIALRYGAQASGPLWFHPDGRRLLGQFGTGATTRVAWLDLNNGAPAHLSFGAPDERIQRQQFAPYTLSDDGASILFAVHQDIPGQQTGDNGPHAELFRAPALGGSAERVLRFPARIYGLSPDGRGRGVYAVTDAGVSHNDVWHIPLADAERGARKLTFGQADEDAPTTDRRGNWLVHTDNSAGATRLSRRNTETGLSETIRIERVDFGAPVGHVRLTLRDAEDSAPAARISLRRQGGKFHAPVNALYRLTAGLVHFYARGVADLELPEGRYELRVFRGPEYRVHQREFDVRAGALADVPVALERWSNPAARGWYSGENHIHANYGYGAWYVTPQAAFDQCEGEDLRVSNLVVANSDGEGVFDREFFSGRPHPLSTPTRIVYWNQEFRSTLWGHMTLFNLTRIIEPVFTGFRDTTNPWDVPTNADIAARTREQGGVASYTHPTNNADVFLHAYSAKGLPIDVALGRIQTMDVMGSAYATSRAVWYHVLNCGFRVPAAAGTDCFINRVRSAPPGFGRVYVHVPAGLSYQGWVDGVVAGRSFVSNGPLLEFTVHGRPIGDTLQFDEPARVRVRGRAEAQFPLHTLELVYNGNVVAKGAVAGDTLSATIEHELAIDRSGWISLRTSGPAVPYWHGGDRGAHTNPVYVEVRGRPLDRASSAQYFLAWIDRLEGMLRERDRMHTQRQHVAAQIEQAREIYRRMLWQ